jgi:hypothetical protein
MEGLPQAQAQDPGPWTGRSFHPYPIAIQKHCQMTIGLGSLTPQYRAGVPGQRKPDSQSVWFCLIWKSGVLLAFGIRLVLEVPDPTAGKNIHISRFSTGKPTPCNDHIYHSHVSDSLNLAFLDLKGAG